MHSPLLYYNKLSMQTFNYAVVGQFMICILYIEDVTETLQTDE